MPFYGELKQATTYTISIDNAPNGVPAAITVLKINRRDNIASAETETVAANGTGTFTGTAGPHIDRVIVDIHPAKGATVLVDIRQGANGFADSVTTDARFVFNAIP